MGRSPPAPAYYCCDTAIPRALLTPCSTVPIITIHIPPLNPAAATVDPSRTAPSNPDSIPARRVKRPRASVACCIMALSASAQHLGLSHMENLQIPMLQKRSPPRVCPSPAQSPFLYHCRRPHLETLDNIPSLRFSSLILPSEHCHSPTHSLPHCRLLLQSARMCPRSIRPRN